MVHSQELLFPGGSTEVHHPLAYSTRSYVFNSRAMCINRRDRVMLQVAQAFYEEAAVPAFYNTAVVVAITASLSQLPASRRVAALEVGAGTGGTASSVLPILDGACSSYTFTDVSEVFLRQARTRFMEYSFMSYQLLNIDADPRFQSFQLHQQDLLLATNVLHATPSIRSTLDNCWKQVRSGGLLVANEGLQTMSGLQITFGLTDGWWLFEECSDPERVGQGSPFLNWRQWEALLADFGFGQNYCMSGAAFLTSSPTRLFAEIICI